MIVRNFHETTPETGPCHGGAGEVENRMLFTDGDFETPLRFLVHTTLPPGSSVGHHRHGDDEEIYVILEGEGTMTVEGQSRTVSAGDALLNRPGWAHGLENTGDSPIKMLVFEVAKPPAAS